MFWRLSVSRCFLFWSTLSDWYYLSEIFFAGCWNIWSLKSEYAQFKKQLRCLIKIISLNFAWLLTLADCFNRFRNLKIKIFHFLFLFGSHSHALLSTNLVIFRRQMLEYFWNIIALKNITFLNDRYAIDFKWKIAMKNVAIRKKL